MLGNTPPNGGFGRFQALHGNNNLAVWLRRRRLLHRDDRQVPERLREQPAGPAGLVGVARGGPGHQRVYNYTLNENGTLVNYGTGPADFKQDVLTRKAVGLVDRRAPLAQPFFLWLTYTAPHSGGPDPNPNPPVNCHGAAKPAPRHAHAFDSEPLPRPPNFNEADVSDKPAEIRNRPLLTAGQIADIQRKYRCRLESILSVDEGVKKIVDCAEGEGRARRHRAHLHLGQRLLPGEHRIPGGKMHIYEESIRVPLQMRGPGIPRGVNVSDLSINADLAPTIVDVANASPGLVMDGRSLIPVAQQPGIEQGRELLIEEPSFDGDPDRALHVRRARHGREGALRPESGPVRARQSP